MDKIIFFHMNQLGDFLFSLPVLEAARREWPDKKLVSFINPELKPLVMASGFVNDVIEKKPGATVFSEISKLRLGGFSKAVLFSESPRSLAECYLSSIPERVGFASASLSFLLTQKSERSGVPSLKNNASLGRSAGLKEIKKDYSGLVKIPVREKDNAEAWITDKKMDDSKIVVISPGTSRRRKGKSWQDAKWEELIAILVGKNCPVVLAGSPAERPGLDNLAKKCPGKVHIFSDFGIIGLGAILLRARLFIGVDSGAMHLAAALGVPVTALFAETDPSQIGPQPLENNLIIRKNSMSEIEVENVWSAVKEKI